MHTIRRLYVYLMSGISLGVLIAGLVGLLGLLFAELGLGGADDAVFTSGRAAADRLSLSAALAGVALPVWLVHWWLAERGVAGRDAAAAAERAADVRALYLSAVLLITLLIGTFSASDLIRHVIDGLFFGGPAGQSFGLSPPSDSLASLLVTAAAWGYHVSVRIRDLGVAPLMGPAVALPRLYLYIAAVFGALLLLLGVHDLIFALVGSLFVAPSLSGAGPSPRLVVGGVAGVLAGGVVWAGHWLYATRIAARGDWRGQSERESLLRRAYLVVVLVGAAAWASALISAGLGTALRAALGVSTEGEPGVTQIAGSLLAAIPFAVAAWLHYRWLDVESLTYGGASRRLGTERLAGYLLAGVGLFLTAFGTAWLLGVLIDLALGGSRTLTGGGEVWRSEAAQAISLVLAGAPLWLWFWYRAQRRHATAPAEEAAAAMRRIYLFAVLGGALIAVIVSIAILLYRGLNLALQNASGVGASDVSGSLGALLVAMLLIGYHALLLRRDVRLRRAVDAEEAAVVAAAVPVSVSVVITGTAGADADAVFHAVSGRLPAGYVMRRQEPETPA